MDVIEFLDEHARRVLYKHFAPGKLCIPAARMVSDFCKNIKVPCEIVSVRTLIRNAIAKRANIWPFAGMHPADKDIPKGATIMIVGAECKVQHKPSDDDMAIHLVPVIDGTLIDLTLDAHALPEHGIPENLPVLCLPAPTHPHQLVGCEIKDFDGDIAYYLYPSDEDYEGTHFWRHWNMVGGPKAVSHLTRLYRSVAKFGETAKKQAT